MRTVIISSYKLESSSHPPSMAAISPTDAPGITQAHTDREQTRFNNVSFAEVEQAKWRSHGRWTMLKSFWAFSLAGLTWAVVEAIRARSIPTHVLVRVIVAVGGFACGCLACIPSMQTTKTCLFVVMIVHVLGQGLYLLRVSII